MDGQVQTGVREGDSPPADEEVPYTAGLGECEGEGKGCEGAGHHSYTYVLCLFTRLTSADLAIY